MPTYAYACKDCGHAFDVQQSFSDDSLTTCPECGGSLRKQFGAVGVVFKGSGFYKTDSRESGKNATASSSSPGKDTSSSGASGNDSSSKDSGTSSSTASSPADSSKSAGKSSTGSSDGSAA